MSNYHWVCFRYRESVRRPGSDKDVRCPNCASPCQNIGYKTPVPPKSKPKLWHALEVAYAEALANYNERRKKDGVRRTHDLEQEIARIQALPDNPGRRELIAQLSKKLETAQTQASASSD